MRFARMSRRGNGRMQVDSLCGGLDTRLEPERIGDGELSACRNMYLDAGELTLRSGFFTEAGRITRKQVTGETPRMIGSFTAADGRFSLVKTPKDILVWNREGRLIGNLVHANDRACLTGFFADGSADTVLFFGSYNDGTDRITRITLWEDDVSFLENLPVYTPVAFINARPSPTLFNFASAGVSYEGFNLLTPAFRSLWTTDGEGLYYSFPIRIAPPASLTYTDERGTAVTWQILSGGSSSAYESVSIGGVTRSLRLCYNGHNNCLWLEERVGDEYLPVALPAAGYADNLTLTATRYDWKAEEGKQVYDMGFSAWFGGTGSGAGGGTRLFLAGNRNAPNLVRYSDVNRPTFFPDNNYFYVGSENEPVTAFGKQDSSLVIFKPREIYGCEYAWTAVSGEELAAGTVPEVTSDAWFPLKQLHGGIGCDCPKTVRLCGNRLVWANARLGKVFALSNAPEGNGRRVLDLSRAVAPSLKEALYTDASAVLWEDRYLLLCGREETSGQGAVPPRELFLFDFGGSEGETESPAWFRWEFSVPILFYGGSFRLSRCFLAGGRDNPLLMGVYHVPSNDFFCPFSLQGDADMQPVYDGTVSVRRWRQTEGGFSTKAYGFGLLFRRKNVEELLIRVKGEGTGSFFWESDRGDRSAPYPVTLRPLRPGPLRLPCRMSRVGTVRLTAEIAGSLRVGGLTWRFKELEEVK